MGSGNTIRGLDPFAVPDTSGPEWDERRVFSYKDTRPTATERGNFSGSYSLALLRDIAEVSKQEGVDPYEMIAIGLQETRLGEAYKGLPNLNYDAIRGNVFNVMSTPKSVERKFDKWFNIMLKEGPTLGYDRASRRIEIKYAVEMLKRKEEIAKSLYIKKFGRPPSRAEVLQGWQGYGVIDRPSFGKGKGLIGWRDIPNGLRILEHIESLKRDPTVRSVVEGGK